MKVNVVLFNDNFEPAIDGVIKTVVSYASILSKEDIVSVVCPKYHKSVDNYTFPVYRASSIKSKKKSIAIPIKASNRKIKKALKKQNPDIFHVHSPFMLGYFALRLAKKRKIPVVTTFHSKYKEDFLQFTKSKFLTKLCMKYIMNFYKRCDAVWTCSNDAMKTLKSYGYEKEITVIENGTDFIYPDNIDYLKSEVSKLYGIDSKYKNILFVGQIIWQKNLKLILDVACLLLEKDKSYRFYFVGTSVIEKEIKEYAKALNILNYCKFIGIIYDRDILKGIYATCDLFFFPSFYDTSSLVVREASVMKIPSLISKDSTCTEIISDNYNGFIEEADKFKMASKIEYLFSNISLLKECGENASRSIPKSWEVIIETVKLEYQKVIDKYKNN